MPRTFAVATTVQDPLLAERLVETLQARGLDAFSRAGGAASSAAFAQVQAAFWDILVPLEASDAASGWIAEVLEELDRDADRNARAAEEEFEVPEEPANPNATGSPST
jgi:hypothetical protein